MINVQTKLDSRETAGSRCELVTITTHGTYLTRGAQCLDLITTVLPQSMIKHSSESFGQPWTRQTSLSAWTLGTSHAISMSGAGSLSISMDKPSDSARKQTESGRSC